MRPYRRFLGASLVLTAASLVSLAWATEPREGGLNELVIYKPGTHAEGLPAVEFVPRGPGLAVEVPPAVHVHRFYYSGNKEFQGPFVSGGPTMIVANHPKTGEKVSIETNLPAGFPELAYTRDSITYIYPERRVVIEYSNHHPNKVAVRFEPGRGAGRKLHERSKTLVTRYRDHREKSELTKIVRDTRKGAKELAKGASKSVETVAAKAVQTSTSFFSGLPGISQLQGTGRQAPAQARESAVGNAADRLKGAVSEDNPTVR